MNRHSILVCLAMLGVPRTRGDEPAHADQGDLLNAEFPAHAGMNRLRSGLPSRPSGVPRTRGDEPAPDSAQGEPRVEFPAHAGMNRSAIARRRCAARVPRTRGDEPLIDQLLKD